MIKNASFTETAEALELEINEGQRLVIPVVLNRYTLYSTVWATSALLGGKLIKCTGFIPGVTLCIHTSIPLDDHWAERCQSYWTLVEPLLQVWIEQEQNPCLHLHLPLPDTEAYLIDDALGELLPAAAEYIHIWPQFHSEAVH